MPPVSTVEQLPEIDVVLISHDHYDHLEADTVRYFADKDNYFIVPLGLGSHLSARGIDSNRVVERDWWESVELGAVTLYCDTFPALLWAPWIWRQSVTLGLLGDAIGPLQRLLQWRQWLCPAF